MRIMWLSVAPWAPTGYGQQTSIFTTRIRDAGHDVAISSTNGLQYAVMQWEGMSVYPGDHTSLNKRLLRHHITREFGGTDDVQVISLWDIWPWVDPAYGGIIADFDGLNIASWVPVDSLPVPPKTLAAIERFNVTPIAMSRHGEQQLRDAGYDPLFVPHGIPTDIFAPHPDRAACREMMGLPQDAFVVGVVANNQGVTPPRKSFPHILQTFAEFRRRHDDAILYLHTEALGVHDGLNLVALAGVFGIPEDAVVFVPQLPYLSGEITKERMARIYTAMDVLANPSMGEGFGIPIIEAQACGTPVITSHYTSMPELTGAGWTVGGQPWYHPASGAMWFNPSMEEILEAMESAYAHRDDAALRAQAREFAVAYDADTVMAEYWVPALERLGTSREVPPLPNRQMRRARRKAGAAA